MLLRSVDDSEELLVLDVLSGHRRRVQLAPVQNALVQVPPAKVARRVTFEGDDRERLVFEEDSRPSEARVEGLLPPASVGVSVVGEASDQRARG